MSVNSARAFSVHGNVALMKISPVEIQKLQQKQSESKAVQTACQLPDTFFSL